MLKDLVYEGRTLFTVDELACNHCGLGRLAPGFASNLVEFRVELDQPMDPNSVCRCTEHNENEGGHPRSLHVFDYPAHPTEGCCAIDVRTWDKPLLYREQLIALARKKGWSIGFGNGFLHLDRRTDYTTLPRAEFNY